MSVIFDQLDNIQTLRFRFTQAIKLGVSLYYIQNSNLKRLVVSDNQITQYNESESISVLQNASQICSDGKSLFCLQNNGDLYQIDQQPKLLVSAKNYMSITPTTAIDHSGRGFYWKNNKPIYSHCKHISTYQDKMTLITIGGKIFNIENNTQIPIQQLNGLGIDGYFKKSLLFQFGGIAITENGEAYCYNNKMIKLKTQNLEDIQANSRFIFGVSGNYILQWSLDDFQNHQFFINQTLFKKMNYGYEIQINCKKKEFQEVKLIFSNQYSQYCCASLQQISKLNQNEQSISVMERTFCRSSVQNLKQQLFDQWDPPSKKKTQEVRQSKQLRGERTERSDTSNLKTDRNDVTQQSQEHRYRQLNNNIFDIFFDKSNKQDNLDYKEQEKSSLQIDPNFPFKNSLKKQNEVLAPLEISKLNLNDKTNQSKIYEQNNINQKFESKQIGQKQLLEIKENQQNNNSDQDQCQRLKEQQQLNQQQDKEELTLTRQKQYQQQNSINMPKQCSDQYKQPSKLLEQYKKQFDQILRSSYEQIIDKSNDYKEGIVETLVDNEINYENSNSQQIKIKQNLQQIRDLYEQPKYKTQNNSLYTLDEESSVEQSQLQDDEEKGRIQRKKQTLLIQAAFDNKPESKKSSKQFESIKQQFSQKDFQSSTLSLENSIQSTQIVVAELQLPPIQSSLNNFLNKLQLKPDKTIDQVLESQIQKEEKLEAITSQDTNSQISQIEVKESKTIKTFLKPDQMQIQKQNKVVEVIDQQSAIHQYNYSDFINQQQDSYTPILQAEKKQQENSKVTNIMSIFDKIQIQPRKKSPTKVNSQKKQDQENILQKIEIIRDSDGQLDENLAEVKNQIQELNLQLNERKSSPTKSNNKIHKNLITFSENITQEEVEDRVMQIVQIDSNLQSVHQKLSPIKYKSPFKDTSVSSTKKHSLQFSEQKTLTKINNNADIKQHSFDIKIPLNQTGQKQGLSSVKVQKLNCSAVRPEKIHTPLRSKRNSTARGSSVETNRFKQLQIETQIVGPVIQNQTPQINNFEILDLSNAMYHIDQTQIEDTTKRTPVAQVLDILNDNQKQNFKILKEPQLLRVTSTSQIPPSLRTNSVGSHSKKTEVSPIKVSKQINNTSSSKISKSLNEETVTLKKKQQDIIFRKLFFRLDIQIKLIKLEFMFNMKLKIGK